MKVVLHIGADKCGSTAIQRTLFQNHDVLKEKGIAYLAGEFGYAHDGPMCRAKGETRFIAVPSSDSGMTGISPGAGKASAAISSRELLRSSFFNKE